jgi:hypothetical protein
MDKAENILTASAGEQALVERIVLQEQQIADALAPYEPHSATYSWFDTLRAIEECINLMTVDWNDEDFERDLISLPLTQSRQVPSRLVQVLRGVKARFGEQFCNRFSNLLIQGMSIAIAFASHGFMNITLRDPVALRGSSLWRRKVCRNKSPDTSSARTDCPAAASERHIPHRGLGAGRHSATT